MYIYGYIYTYIYIYVCVCRYTSTNICINICIRIYIRRYMFVWTRAYLHEQHALNLTQWSMSEGYCSSNNNIYVQIYVPWPLVHICTHSTPLTVRAPVSPTLKYIYECIYFWIVYAQHALNATQGVGATVPWAPRWSASEGHPCAGPMCWKTQSLREFDNAFECIPYYTTLRSAVKSISVQGQYAEQHNF